MGHGEQDVHALHETLRTALRSGARATEVGARLCDDHAEVRQAAREFVEQGAGVLVAAGGGGTLRAAVEGAIAATGGTLPGPGRLRIASLRMGSGNVIARRLGGPPRARDALLAAARGVTQGKSVPCAVMRCAVGTSDGGTEVHHGLTFAGFGRFGRVPGDLHRWRRRHPLLRAAGALARGVEAYNDLEYTAGHAVRCVGAAFDEAQAERIHVRWPSGAATVRLLSALAMNLRLGALPFDPRVDMGDAAFGFALVPFESRASVVKLLVSPRRAVLDGLRVRVGPGEKLTLTLTDRASAEAFLDEDPLVFHRYVELDVAGFVSMIPAIAAEGVSS
jgi:hypothetical protein